MYDPKSKCADDFINHEEIMETLEYAEKNKHNRELIDQILDKARLRKGLSHREAAVLLDCDLEDKNQEIYALAEQKGLFVMEAFWVRFRPVLQKMQEIIASGEIGEVVHARSDYGFIAKGARKDIKFNSDLGGGALLDIGIYNLGFMHMVMGEAPVSFSSRVHINEYGTDDFSNILLEYPGQRTADITTAIGMDIPREAAIFGTKGSITLPDFQKAERMTVRLYEGDSYNVEIPFEVNGFEYQIREASRCVAEKLSTSKILKAEDSLTILKLMDDIRESWGMKFAFEG